MTPRYPNVRVRLVGEDGNAFAIMGRVTRAMRRAGLPPEEVAAFRDEATAGDYDQLLATVMRWVEVEMVDKWDRFRWRPEDLIWQVTSENDAPPQPAGVLRRAADGAVELVRGSGSVLRFEAGREGAVQAGAYLFAAGIRAPDVVAPLAFEVSEWAGLSGSDWAEVAAHEAWRLGRRKEKG